MQGPAVEFGGYLTLQCGGGKPRFAPVPVDAITLLMSDDDLAADQRVAVETSRQRANPHTVVYSELQRFHPWPLQLTFRTRLPAHGVGLGCQSAEPGEGVVDVAAQ